jgi:sporulation protein YlmC with PRC-barrel domain
LSQQEHEPGGGPSDVTRHNTRNKKMRNPMKLGALIVTVALAAGPVMAQPSATHSTTVAPATGNVGNTTNTSPSDRNPVMTMNGEARASKVIGSSVYNDHDEKLGSVDDLVIAKDGKMSAVLSVGGYLGMGSKYVEVPYASLTYGNTQKDSDNRVVLKGATKDSLKSQTAYNYYKA